MTEQNFIFNNSMQLYKTLHEWNILTIDNFSITRNMLIERDVTSGVRVMSGVCLVSGIGNADYILGGSPLSRLSVQSKSVRLSFCSFCQQISWNTTLRNTAAIFTVVTKVNAHTSRHLGFLQQAHVAVLASPFF